MRPLPERRYELVIWYQARVHQDSRVAFDKRRYLVPRTLIGQQLWLRAMTAPITIGGDYEEIVATHARRGRTMRSTIDARLPERRAPWRHRGRVYWEDRADQIAPEVGAYARAIFHLGEALSMLRTPTASSSP